MFAENSVPIFVLPLPTEMPKSFNYCELRYGPSLSGAFQHSLRERHCWFILPETEGVIVASIVQRTEEISNRLERAGLSRIAPAVLKLLRPSIRLIVGEQSEQPVTRLGGVPNMPADIAWPTRRSGDPHSFLAQVDLAGLGVCDGLPLPGTGSLFFFCDAEHLPHGGDQADVNDGIKVVHSFASLSDNGLLRPPPGLHTEYVFKGFALKPTLDLTAPAQDVWEIESLHLTDAEADAYGELVAQVSASNGSVHRMGGYPNLVQYGQLEFTGDAEAPDWRLLLQLDSEDDAGMIWGDQGKLYFMIREQDLRSASFDKAWMDWQCG
jgi:uncharacterized protein YwqG